MAEKITAYEILGVPEDADKFQIRDAAQEKAKLINNAFNLLYDESTRADYDAKLTHTKEARRKAQKARLSLWLMLLEALGPVTVFSFLALICAGVAWAVPMLGIKIPYEWQSYRYIPALACLGLGVIAATIKVWSFSTRLR